MELTIFKGIVLGFIYSVTLVSGTVWCAQVTIQRGFRAGLAAGAAVALAQGLLGGAAVLALYGLTLLPLDLGTSLRLLAVVVFLYMSGKMFMAPKATTISTPLTDTEPSQFFTTTFALAITMPMRLGGFLAFTIASGIPMKELSPVSVLLLANLIGFGSLVWFGYIVLLARIFGNRVPEHITLRSLNKLNGLSGVVFLLVALIAGAPLALKL